MPIQQGMRTLPLYDILATLFPGSTLLIGLAVVFGVETSTLSNSFAAVFFVIFGYLIGAILRWFGRELEGRPVLFSNTRKLASGSIDEHEITERTENRIGRFFEGIPLYDSNIRRQPMIVPTQIENEFENFTNNRFDLDKSDQDDIGSGKLLKVVLSHLETTPYGRSIRFQAIHSFQRNTWAAMILISGASVIAILQKMSHAIWNIPGWLVIPGTQLPSWGALIVIFGCSFLLAFVFGELKTQFNQLFIEYVFTESYLDYKSSENVTAGSSKIDSG